MRKNLSLTGAADLLDTKCLLAVSGVFQTAVLTRAFPAIVSALSFPRITMRPKQI